MTLKCRLGLLVLLACTLTPATAADCKKNTDRWLDDACAVQAVESTGAEIEQAIGALLAKADDTRRPLLLNAHKAWLNYRDQQCKIFFDLTRVQHSERHGSMAPNFERSCHLRLNDLHLVELRGLTNLSR
jgi:uncharacterized protein YecT (DUF1311 family)